MKRYAFLLLLVPLAACVTAGKFHDQEAATASQKSRADAAESAFSAYRSTATETIDAARLENAGLKTSLADLQKSNKDLSQTLDAKKGELTQKVAELIKDRDAQSAKAADLSTQVAQLSAALAGAQRKAAEAEAAKAAELAAAKKSFDDLSAGLKSEIAAGEIKITQLQGKLTVNLVDRILFDSGKAEVKDDGRKVLDKVGAMLNAVADKNIRIEGHTDDKPITGELQAKYPTNWELSTARATAVARYLQDKAKVDPARLVAAGYGEYHPVASNATAESRALNRRIEIVLVPKD